MAKGLGFGDLFKIGAILGEAAYNDAQVKKNNETEEYQEELRANVADLNKESDLTLLKNFHKEYDDNWGKGLFMMDAGNRMDPMFMAYMKVFEQRNIERVEVRCCECNRRLGYRMIPKDFNVISEEYDLTHGYCNCQCGKCRSWQIYGDYNGESYINVYDF